MARGPLPSPTKVRRNAPTIPTTELPADGFRGEMPACPYDLAEAGRAWWDWAWTLPQAAAWDDGAVYFAARRAQLEDDVAALDTADDLGLTLEEILGAGDEREVVQRIEWTIRKLKGLAGGKTGLFREMRELDNRLGLNPKGLADLRWSIVRKQDDKADSSESRGPSKATSARRSRLSVVA